MNLTINRTIIVPATNVGLVRLLAAKLSSGGSGMFESRLPPDSETPTHFISSGQIDTSFDLLLTDVTALFQAAEGLATMEECQNIVDTIVIVDCNIESAEDTYIRLNLQ